jgi:hypothetical protein
MCAISSALTPSMCEYFEAIKMNLFSRKKAEENLKEEMVLWEEKNGKDARRRTAITNRMICPLTSTSGEEQATKFNSRMLAR